MPEISENRQVFGETWDWSRQGDEWSDWLGGTPRMWRDVIRPRLDAYLPAGNILEIAPGYGRVTQYLKDVCDRLIAVDLNEQCIAACRQRFAEADNTEFHVNDGRSLDMVPDHSVDLIVSWDSLVHVEMNVLDAYLRQFPRILRPTGHAWLHHSNAAAYPISRRLAMRLPEKVRRRLVDRGVVFDVYAWRATSVSAAEVRRACLQGGLVVSEQELISWEHGRWLSDCITTFRVGMPGPTDQAVTRNRHFGLGSARDPRHPPRP